MALTLFDQALAPDLIARRAAAYPESGQNPPAFPSSMLAHYDFSKAADRTVLDLTGNGRDLELPEFFHPPGRRMLAAPDFRNWASTWFLTDVLLNLVGFACFGYLFAAILPVRLRSGSLLAASHLVSAPQYTS